jgi:osmotically-inducible protein OsmY
MSRNTLRGPSRSYDDIVRKTVVDPDSSVRPTREQEEQARHGFRALDADEQIIHDRVQQALAALGGSAAKVDVEVNRELVTLRGQVAGMSTLRAIEEAVARVTGVDTIYNQIVVAAS